MTEQSKSQVMVWQGARGEEVKLSIESVRTLFNVPLATDHEIFFFLRFCVGQRLNPFLREVHLIKFDAKKAAAIVVGKDTFTQRAESHPDFDGFQAGVIVRRGDTIFQEAGAWTLPGDVLIGGWFEGRRRNHSVSFFHRVTMEEYAKGQSTWKQLPATMIRKVAIVQGLREMFPTIFTGLYDSSEMGVDLEVAEAVASTNEHTVPMGKVEGGETKPVSTIGVPLNGMLFFDSDKYPGNWSAKDSDGIYVKLGNYVKALVGGATGKDEQEINAELKLKYGVTSSKLHPDDAHAYLGGYGLLNIHEEGVPPGGEQDEEAS